MSSKLLTNKRRNHASKILDESSKKRGDDTSKESVAAPIKKKTPIKGEAALREQYKIIRDDLLKLRSDVMKGFDLARSWMESKSSLLKAK